MFNLERVNVKTFHENRFTSNIQTRVHVFVHKYLFFNFFNSILEVRAKIKKQNSRIRRLYARHIIIQLI